MALPTVAAKNIINSMCIRFDCILKKQEKNKNMKELVIRPSHAGWPRAN
jgi:hypothetical protein